MELVGHGHGYGDESCCSAEGLPWGGHGLTLPTAEGLFGHKGSGCTTFTISSMSTCDGSWRSTRRCTRRVREGARAARGRAVQGRAGQGRAGQGRAGQGSAGQGRGLRALNINKHSLGTYLCSGIRDILRWRGVEIQDQERVQGPPKGLLGRGEEDTRGPDPRTCDGDVRSPRHCVVDEPIPGIALDGYGAEVCGPCKPEHR